LIHQQNVLYKYPGSKSIKAPNDWS